MENSFQSLLSFHQGKESNPFSQNLCCQSFTEVMHTFLWEQDKAESLMTKLDNIEVSLKNKNSQIGIFSYGNNFNFKHIPQCI